MRVEYIVQNGDISLYNYLKLEMQNNYNNVYIFSKCIDDTGINIVEDNLLDEKTKLFVITGIDKKNTNKGILERLIDLTKEVYVYDNNNEIQFENNLLILENKKFASIYIFGGEFNEFSMSTNFNIVLKNTFDFNDENDKKEFKNIISRLIEIKEYEKFFKLDKSAIKKLVDDKIIFSNKVYNHSVKSISELIGKKKEEKEESIPSLEDVDINLDLNNINSIDIDFDLDEEINEDVQDNKEKKKNKEEKNDLDIEIIDDDILEEESLLKENLNNNYNLSIDDISSEEDAILKDDSNFDMNSTLDINDLLFSESNLELAKKIDNKEDNNKIINKKIDLKNITNYIFELPEVLEKDKNQVKVPNYIKDLIPLFFEMDNTKQVNVNDKTRKERKITVEIIDVKNDCKYLDKHALIMHEKGKSNISFFSDVFLEVDYREKDILRISKISSDVYHFEFISKNLQESKVWEKMMNQKFRNNERKYGFI